jgi:alpha-D-xyloside xylohydrolase
MFREGVECGYFIKRLNGDVWQWDMWQPGMAIVDFTNPKACKWFSSKLEALLDMGVDCFKTDFGERIPTDVVYFDGSDPIKMHNYYTYLYNKVVFELLQKKRGKGEAVLFARSATVGGQKFPVHWGGDCWSDYESMAESLRGGLSLTMSGFGFWSHDIGGFESTSTPDVYKRWCAFGLLSTHSRLHGSSSYRVPWAYDEEAVDVVRFFAKLKASLMPYLYSNAVITSKLGLPSMRSMVMEFTHDPTCAYLDKQYMLGDKLLVAPIFNDAGMAQYYLPEGTWTNYLTGEKKQGNRWYNEAHGYLSIPLYVRENSILAVGEKNGDAVYNYSENVNLKVYELIDDIVTTTVLYNQEAKLELEARILKQGNTITIEVDTDEHYYVTLINCTTITSITNASYEVIDNHTIITPEKKGNIIIKLLTSAIQ